MVEQRPPNPLAGVRFPPLLRRKICRVRLARSRTPGSHPGNQGFESPTRYKNSEKFWIRVGDSNGKGVGKTGVFPWWKQRSVETERFQKSEIPLRGTNTGSNPPY